MANWREPNEEDRRSYAAWVESRPATVKAICLRFEPWKLYRMKSSGHRVMIRSVSEGGTLTVLVLARFNVIKMERQVFGIEPDDLEECELPGPDEPVGVTMTHEEQRAHIDKMRAENGVAPISDEEWDSYNHGAEPEEGTKH